MTSLHKNSALYNHQKVSWTRLPRFLCRHSGTTAARQPCTVECTQFEMTVEPPTSDTLNQPALTLQRSASLLKHRAASADGLPQDVVCRWQGFLTVTFLSPHCHSLIPSIQLTDELPLRRHSLSHCSTKQSSQSAAKISGLLRERLQWLSLVVTSFPAFTEVTRRCQI